MSINPTFAFRIAPACWNVMDPNTMDPNTMNTANYQSMDSERKGVSIHLTGPVLIVLGTLVAASFWGAYLFSKTEKPAPPAETTNVAAAFIPFPTPDAGPWGKLEGLYFNIERPDSFLTIADPFTEKARWVFEKQSHAEVEALFDRAGLSPIQKASLFNPAGYKETADGVEISPDHRLLLELSTGAREIIYPVLGRSALNTRHQSPFCFLERWLVDRFQTDGLAPATIEAAKKLLYQQGNVVCFSDLPALFEIVTAPQERKAVLKALSRSPSLLVTLHVNSETKLNGIINYWSRGWHAKDRGAFLRSLSQTQKGGSVDIIHLLPPFARERLNTFPFPQLGSNNDKPNCYWTALNFAQAEQDPALTRRDKALEKLQANYYPITDKPAFGDVICLLDSKGEIFHMANYIAANIVFTKNGYHHHNPWILMTMEDMLAYYPSYQPCTTFTFRRKDQPPAASK